MKCVGKAVGLVAVVLISATCLAQVEVIRGKKDGRVISVEAHSGLLGKQTPQKAAETVDVVAAAVGHLKQHGGNFGVSDVEQELRMKQAESDSLGMTHVHFAQRYKGLPVFGGALIVHVNSDGTLRSINGNFAKGIEVETTPSLGEEEAVTKVEQYWRERHGEVAASEGESDVQRHAGRTAVTDVAAPLSLRNDKISSRRNFVMAKW